MPTGNATVAVETSDVGPPSDELSCLMNAIVDALDKADNLDLGMVAIHLDHALALCQSLRDGDDPEA